LNSTGRKIDNNQHAFVCFFSNIIVKNFTRTQPFVHSFASFVSHSQFLYLYVLHLKNKREREKKHILILAFFHLSYTSFFLSPPGSYRSTFAIISFINEN